MTAHLEICREIREQVLWDRHALDHGVFLPFDVHDRLVEDDAVVLIMKHLHETLHEVLRMGSSVTSFISRLTPPHLDLVPDVVVRFEHAEMVLDRNDVAVPFDEFLE